MKMSSSEKCAPDSVEISSPGLSMPDVYGVRNAPGLPVQDHAPAPAVYGCSAQSRSSGVSCWRVIHSADRTACARSPSRRPTMPATLLSPAPSKNSCEAVTSVPSKSPRVEEVGDPGHRVRSVDRGGALLQDLDAVDGDGGKGVDVDVASADQPRGQVHLAATVEQHEGPRRPQAAQVDVGHGLRHGGDFVRVVPALSFAHHPVAQAERLDELGHQRKALFLQPAAGRHRHRIGQLRGRCLRAGAGDDQFVELERREAQPQVYRRSLPRGYRDLFGHRQVAEDVGGELVRSGRHILDRVAPVGVGDRPYAERLDEYLYARDGLLVGGVDHGALDGPRGLRPGRGCGQGSRQRQRTEYARESCEASTHVRHPPSQTAVPAASFRSAIMSATRSLLLNKTNCRNNCVFVAFLSPK